MGTTSTLRKELMLVISLVFLNIVVRLPVIPHEFGADSFYVHTFAKQIVEHENAPWIIHPLSFFGLYPLSNASVVPFIIGILSMISGLGIEEVVLYASMAFSLLGLFAAYALAGRIKKTIQFKFITGFLFSISPPSTQIHGMDDIHKRSFYYDDSATPLGYVQDNE